MAPNTPTFLLVHGAWHGSWCWARLRRELDVLGIVTAVVDLPTADATAAATLDDDAAVIRTAVDAIDGEVVVVAHSYGGAPTSQALCGASNVRHILYLAAFVIEDGHSLLGTLGGEVPPWWEVDELSVTPRTPAQIFYSDMTVHDAQPFVDRMRPHGKLAYTTTISGAAWKVIPSTYIVCELDESLPPAVQRAMATQLPAVAQIDSGHSPFASKPKELATLLISLVPNLLPAVC